MIGSGAAKVWKTLDVTRIPQTLSPSHLLQTALASTRDCLDVCAGVRPAWSIDPAWSGFGLALDINPMALALAEDAFPDFHYVCADATALPVSSRHFSLVTMIAALTVLPSTAVQALYEASRVLRHRGILYICDFLFDPLNPNYAHRYGESGDPSTVVARDADGYAIYVAKHWRLEELDQLLDGLATRKAATFGRVRSRSGFDLTGFEALYERL